jgi:hypothetical protein
MRALAILGRDHPGDPCCNALKLGDTTGRCATLDIPDPSFDPAVQPDHVLQRVLEDRSSHDIGAPRTRAGDLAGIVSTMMWSNLTLMRNCLGSTADLAHAVEEHMAERLFVQMDSVFTDDAVGFLARTDLAPDRFGKVTFAYA